MNDGAIWYQIVTVLAWCAMPVTLICVIDDWFFRPKRLLAAPGAPDPAILRSAYLVLPVLLLAALLYILLADRLDFSFALLLVSVVSGIVWGIDHWLVAPSRVQAAQDRGLDPQQQPVPVTVDYARSFFPVALIVLLIRAFIFEPFRIPSDSMMPTLQDGDFIIVNKFAYGLRLPVLNTKILTLGEPQRGEVVVFRYPPDPGINYIKRVVGLPGDHVIVHNDQLIINGTPVALTSEGRYDDGCYHNMRLSSEVLGSHHHETLSCLSPEGLAEPASASCDRRIDHNYRCVETDPSLAPDSGDTAELIVPPGNYLMIGDNRDNSSDGRYWGWVPEDHLVGRAARIWLNFDFKRSGVINWHRIGKAIE